MLTSVAYVNCLLKKLVYDSQKECCIDNII